MSKKSAVAQQLVQRGLHHSVLAILPAYNVEYTVSRIVKKIKSLVDNIIIVDDGSIDKTHKLLKKLNVQLINHKRNQGLGCALRDGFKVASVTPYDIVVTLDSDGQHDVSEIDNLVKRLIDSGADAVIGSRLLNRSQWSNFPRQRLIGNIILTFLTNLAVGNKVTTDSQSGFRAIKTSCLSSLDLHERKMAISSEIILELAKNGFTIKEVPIAATYDKEVSNVRAISDISRILWMLFRKRVWGH